MKMKVRTEHGYIVAYAIKNENGIYNGIRAEYIDDNDNDDKPGCPAVSLEATQNSDSEEISARIYNYDNENPLWSLSRPTVDKTEQT